MRFKKVVWLIKSYDKKIESEGLLEVW